MAQEKSKSRMPVISNQVQYLDIKLLEHADQPYREITPEALEDLKNSLHNDTEFFKRRPCLVNRLDGKLIVYAGNQKMDAAKMLDWETIPCIVSEISFQDMTKRMLLDNTHAGVFDTDFISATYDSDFLLGSVGFDISKFDDKIGKPENIVDTTIDSKIYALYKGHKIPVDVESDYFLQEDIKAYVAATTTIFGYVLSLKERFEANYEKEQ